MMTLRIHLEPEVEKRLRAEAARHGQDAAEYVKALVEAAVHRTTASPQARDAAVLMRLPLEKRRRILASAAEEAAPLYNADLALPAEQRELTAFTILDGEPFYDYEDDDAA